MTSHPGDRPDPGDRRAAELLRFAAERGEPRGIDALCAAAEAGAGAERNRRRWRDAAAVAAAVAALAWFSGLGGLAGRAGAPSDEVASSSAEAVYAEQCAGCHGAGGLGGPAPPLAGGSTAPAFADAAAEADFVLGRSPGARHVPLVAVETGEIAPEDVLAVVRYVRELPA
ncbi:MAG: c-type cytochrome [Actinomycetota bacterium]|nr:c-type cytochrome [Actinomycetota bacterium]